ncbi:hypothetical protein BJ878DRAFT_478121 [Calycina marina]|uniref:Uncharacterized protein n=1 Tax=Calycina marina TaxID=1763456 RepID=A0A9P8CGV9_9HELO|nr:hypothetical protein BJ878DRAFT_478121 [Calycina marina]
MTRTLPPTREGSMAPYKGSGDLIELKAILFVAVANALTRKASKKGRGGTRKPRLSLMLSLDRNVVHLRLRHVHILRVYYITAANRFADNVGQCLEVLLFNIKENIGRMFENALGLNTGGGEMKCRNLMAENQVEAEECTRLQKQKTNLMKADRLEQLVTDFGYEPEAATDNKTDSSYDHMEDDDDVIDNADEPSSSTAFIALSTKIIGVSYSTGCYIVC